MKTYISFLCRAPDERQHDQTFVPPLVSVHCVHLHADEGRGLQQSGDGLQLLPVGSNHSDVAGSTARLKAAEASRS